MQLPKQLFLGVGVTLFSVTFALAGDLYTIADPSVRFATDDHRVYDTASRLPNSREIEAVGFFSEAGTTNYGIGGGLMIGAEGWADSADTTWPNNFGLRYGANVGLANAESRNGVQIGLVHGLYDMHGQAGGTSSAAGAEQQFLLTTGIFHRSDVAAGERVSAGLVWDYLSDNSYSSWASSIDLHQLRYQIGYALSEVNEVGLAGAFHLNDERFGPGFLVRGQDQFNLFWDHVWESGATTRAYIGLADGPTEVNLGARCSVPLANSVAATGFVHYGVPSGSGGRSGAALYPQTEEIWSIGVALVFTFGSACSDSVSGHYADPLLGLPDNGSFAKVSNSRLLD